MAPPPSDSDDLQVRLAGLHAASFGWGLFVRCVDDAGISGAADAALRIAREASGRDGGR